MSVAVRITSRGMPRRAIPAAFTLASTATRATGGLYHRVTASYGTVGVHTPGPPNVMAVPPGPTNGHTAAIPTMFPTWSVVKASLPRVLPSKIPHGVAGLGWTLAVPNPPQDAVVKPALRVRQGGGRGRVTTSPKPTFKWVRQGG